MVCWYWLLWLKIQPGLIAGRHNKFVGDLMDDIIPDLTRPFFLTIWIGLLWSLSLFLFLYEVSHESVLFLSLSLVFFAACFCRLRNKQHFGRLDWTLKREEFDFTGTIPQKNKQSIIILHDSDPCMLCSTFVALTVAAHRTVIYYTRLCAGDWWNNICWLHWMNLYINLKVKFTSAFPCVQSHSFDFGHVSFSRIVFERTFWRSVIDLKNRMPFTVWIAYEGRFYLLSCIQ